MWIAAVYHQVSLFSLKPADATATGGRSLLVPTPFSIKMALLDAALRTRGLSAAQAFFPLIRDLRIAASPPPLVVVSNCFMRIQKPQRKKKGGGQGEGDTDAESGGGLFQRTVGFREYVYYSGPLGLAFGLPGGVAHTPIVELLAQITYFGKRGGFFQLAGPPMALAECPREHLPLDVEAVPPESLLQLLDDCRRGDEGRGALTFEQADIYSGKPIGSGRVIRRVALPYRLRQSSDGFSAYERIYATR